MGQFLLLSFWGLAFRRFPSPILGLWPPPYPTNWSTAFCPIRSKFRISRLQPLSTWENVWQWSRHLFMVNLMGGWAKASHLAHHLAPFSQTNIEPHLGPLGWPPIKMATTNPVIKLPSLTCLIDSHQSFTGSFIMLYLVTLNNFLYPKCNMKHICTDMLVS